MHWWTGWAPSNLNQPIRITPHISYPIQLRQFGLFIHVFNSIRPTNTNALRYLLLRAVQTTTGRLTKILSKRTLAIEKSDEMQKKVNVLSAFSAVKPGEGNQEKEGQGKEVKEERRDQAEL